MTGGPDGSPTPAFPAVMLAEAPTLDRDLIADMQYALRDRFGPILDKFLAETEKMLGVIESALPREDWDSVTRTAHKLKAATAQIGATRLSRLVADIESLGERRTNGATDGFSAAPLLDSARNELAAVKALLEQPPAL